MKNLTSLSRRGVLPSLDVPGEESGKWQEGRVTRRDVTGNRRPSLDKPETMRESSVKKTVDPVKREWMERRLCVVLGLSDRDHLFTGERVDRGGPFERDGTTRRSRGKKWRA
ncbi:hypothetical protein CRG98_049982 [Punica granatum]|uniref:Uncharacterized protein n=1 Tax=Punica granatum TaxID=22663 RepID=A0A2I0H1G0_PUNGR|nr:hypothetical protein CRG98_049982 [Punica granatum]